MERVSDRHLTELHHRIPNLGQTCLYGLAKRLVFKLLEQFKAEFTELQLCFGLHYLLLGDAAPMQELVNLVRLLESRLSVLLHFLH